MAIRDECPLSPGTSARPARGLIVIHFRTKINQDSLGGEPTMSYDFSDGRTSPSIQYTPPPPTSAPEYAYPPTVPPTSHATPGKSKRPALIIIAALTVLSLAGVGAWVLIGKTTGGSGPGTFTANGSFEVFSSYDAYLGSSGVRHYGRSCQGADGYDDMRQGTQGRVSVDNQVVAYGEFGPGRYVGGNCIFQWKVTGVPAGKPRYSVEVNNRGNLFYHEKELRAGVALELGQGG